MPSPQPRPSKPTPALPKVTPIRASTALSGLGVCAHLGDGDYGPLGSSVVDMVQKIGARTVRTNLGPNNKNGVAQALALQDAGVRIHAPLPLTKSWKTKGALAKAAESYLESMAETGVRLSSVEFSNEFNHNGPGWDAAVRQEMESVAEVCAKAGITFFGPSLLAYKTEEDAPKIAKDSDGKPLYKHFPAGVAVHSYVSDQGPEANRTIERLEIIRKTFGGDVPAFLTETGWHDGGDKGSSSPAQAAAFAPRVALSYLTGENHPFEGVYFYELIDEPGDTRGGKEQHFGIYKADGTPKPVATALANLQIALADSRPRAGDFELVDLELEITGGADLQSRLFQKAGGSYFLALWQAWGPNDLDRAAESVTIKTGKSSVFKAWNDLNIDAAGTRDTGTSLTVSVGSNMSLVRIRPE